MIKRPKFKRGDCVYKSGTGYSGPGVVYKPFLGDDGQWRFVVGHQLAGGKGTFYHIYGEGQLRLSKKDSA